MKQLLPALIVSSFLALPISPLFTPVYPVFAQESSPAPKVSERRIKLEEAKEKIASRAAQAKEKIGKFKDKRRANVASKINTQLPRINEQRTNQLSSSLDRMGEILSKLENRVAEAAANGKDTTDAQNAITDAKTAISTAQTSVDAQAEKEYGIVVSTEGKIGADAKSAVALLQSDLKSIRELVIGAKQSVASAISTSATTLGGNK